MSRVSRKAPKGAPTKVSPTIAAKASRQLLIILLCAAASLSLLAAVTYSTMSSRTDLATSGIGGPFSMTAQDGRTVTNADFAGRPYLVFFGYTHCPDFCPTALFDISAALKELGPDKRISVLFVSVDPARDTPEVLKTYLENFDTRIIGLTGDADKTQAIAKAFRVYYKPVPGENGDYTMDHTGIVYLMDKTGRFVESFKLSQPPKQAAKELERYL